MAKNSRRNRGEMGRAPSQSTPTPEISAQTSLQKAIGNRDLPLSFSINPTEHSSIEEAIRALRLDVNLREALREKGKEGTRSPEEEKINVVIAKLMTLSEAQEKGNPQEILRAERLLQKSFDSYAQIYATDTVAPTLTISRGSADTAQKTSSKETISAPKYAPEPTPPARTITEPAPRISTIPIKRGDSSREEIPTGIPVGKEGIWKNKDGETPVIVVGKPRKGADGKKYVTAFNQSGKTIQIPQEEFVPEAIIPLNRGTMPRSPGRPSAPKIIKKEDAPVINKKSKTKGGKIKGVRTGNNSPVTINIHNYADARPESVGEMGSHPSNTSNSVRPEVGHTSTPIASTSEKGPAESKGPKPKHPYETSINPTFSTNWRADQPTKPKMVEMDEKDVSQPQAPREMYGPPRPPRTKEEIARGRFIEKELSDPRVEQLRKNAAEATHAFNKQEGGWRFAARGIGIGKEKLTNARIARDTAIEEYSKIMGEKSDAAFVQAVTSARDKHWDRDLSEKALAKWGSKEARMTALLQRYRGASVAKPFAQEIQKYMQLRQEYTDKEMQNAPLWKKTAHSFGTKWSKLSKKQKFLVIALGGGAAGLVLGGGTAAAGGVLGYAALRGLRAAGAVWITPWVAAKAGRGIEWFRNTRGKNWVRTMDAAVKQEEERKGYAKANLNLTADQRKQLGTDAFGNRLVREQINAAENKKDNRIKKGTMVATAFITGGGAYMLSNPNLYGETEMFRDTVHGSPKVVPQAPPGQTAPTPQEVSPLGEGDVRRGVAPSNLPTNPKDSIPQTYGPNEIPVRTSPSALAGKNGTVLSSSVEGSPVIEQRPSAPLRSEVPRAPAEGLPEKTERIIKETVNEPNRSRILFTEQISVSKGDTVWGLSEKELLNDPRFQVLNRAQQDYVLDYRNKVLQSELNQLSTPEKVARGFASGNIDRIQAGGKINLSIQNQDAVLNEAVQKAHTLNEAQQTNILRNRGYTPEQIKTELSKPIAIPVVEKPAAPDVVERSPKTKLTAPKDLVSVPPTPTPDTPPPSSPSMEAIRENVEADREILLSDAAEKLRGRELTPGEASREELAALQARDLERVQQQARVDAIPATPTNQDAPDQYMQDQSGEEARQFEMDVRIEQHNQVQEFFGTPRRFWSIFGAPDDGTRVFGNIEWRGAEDFLAAAKKDVSGMAQSIGMQETRLREFVQYVEQMRDTYNLDTDSKTIGSLLMDITRQSVRSAHNPN